MALPFGALWWPWLGLAGVTAASIGFVVGGLLLSPDLDTRSNATRRWGPLRWLWWPYRQWVSHRSLLSHTPLIGSAGRLLYLAAIGLGLCLLGQPLGLPNPARLCQNLAQLWQRHQNLIVTVLVGIEASCWLHLILDGDPMPRLPRRLRRRRGRLR